MLQAARLFHLLLARYKSFEHTQSHSVLACFSKQSSFLGRAGPHITNMKLHLFMLFFAAAITAVQGYRSRILDNLENIYQDEALQERLLDPLMQEDSHNETCDCDEECDQLHVTRLPHNVRVSLMSTKGKKIN